MATDKLQREQLLTGATQLGLELPQATADKLLRFADELLAWNQRINLTAITRPSEVISHHLLDSLAVAPYIGPGALLDVGSGGGLPGLPLAILRPELMLCSIDSRHKKIAFQRHAARSLDLGNYQAVCERVEAWSPARPFTQIISRAFASLGQFAQLAGDHLAPGGFLLAMKGREPDDELQQMPAGWQLVKMHRLTVPGLAAERHLLVFQRVVS